MGRRGARRSREDNDVAHTNSKAAKAARLDHRAHAAWCVGGARSERRHQALAKAAQGA
jgi:hypothetical protein